MIKRFSTIVKYSMVFFFVIFTITTLITSGQALLGDREAIYHTYIMARAGMCLAAAVIVGIFLRIKLRPAKTKSEGDEAKEDGKTGRSAIAWLVLLGLTAAGLVSTFFWARDLFDGAIVITCGTLVAMASITIVYRKRK